MSYYNPGQPGTYPYGYTPAAYAQTPGSYASYSYPPTAVTGYGTTWPYYSYVPPQHRTTTTTAVPRSLAATTTTATGANRGTSFATTHTPASYADTINAAGGSGNTRTGGPAAGSKRQPNLKGLFTKERERVPETTAGRSCPTFLVRNLMYGFGDDRNPANDTVNVMEEILAEYIVDVVSSGRT
jgi:transcription initiation factor TFIID subunit 13